MTVRSAIVCGAILVVISLFVTQLAPPLAAAAPASMDCTALTTENLQLNNTRITKAALVTNDRYYPAYCLLQGQVNQRTGVDGKKYAISFEMRLPNAWNGRFLHQVNGGNDGAVVPAEGGPSNPGELGRISALARGF